MASSSSGPLSPSAVYQLGQYQFRLNVTKSQEGDSTQIQAQMTKDGQSKYHSIYVDGDAAVESWRVEANESTADVYATVRTGAETLVDGTLNAIDFPKGETVVKSEERSGRTVYWGINCQEAPVKATIVNNKYAVFAMAGEQSTYPIRFFYPSGSSSPSARRYTYDGRTVTYIYLSYPYVGMYASVGPLLGLPFSNVTPYDGKEDNLKVYVAWSLIYAAQSTDGEKLVARFAIETQQAVDPTQPEQWDEQPDTGDPQYRLDLSVWGALSGRHNDPLSDPSYSYVPADQDSVKGYGGGGDGGHGGGGGGGASTVIVYDFATDKAGSKEINAYSRRHGYGSSGGRGGRGGDGCIIVYY